MIKNAGPIGDLGVTPLILIKASLDTVIYFLILRFCIASSGYLKSLRPHLTEVATIIVLSGCALVATLSYTGYEGLMASLAPAQMEIYNWFFLALVLAPVGAIVVIITKRLDFFTNLMFGKLNDAVAYAPPAPQAQSWNAPPASAPPGGPPPPVGDDGRKQMLDRLAAIQRKVSTAAEVAEKLQTQGKLSGEIAESASKMKGYLEGAAQSLEARDLASAKGFADWAEYEASRVLLTVN